MLCRVLLLAVLVSWTRSRYFTWDMLDSRQARLPENAQEILFEEPETIEENDNKLTSLFVVQTKPGRTKWNRISKRAQNNNNKSKIRKLKIRYD